MASSQRTRDDPELLSEMCRLLSEELQRVQNETQRLQENSTRDVSNIGPSLQEENKRLKRKIADAKAKLHHNDGSLQATTNHDVQLAELSEEAVERDADYIREKLSTKLETMRGKCKTAKATGATLRESIAEVEDQMDAFKRLLEEETGRLDHLSNESKKLATPFDFSSFLSNSEREDEEDALQTISFPAPHPKLVLPEAVSSLWWIIVQDKREFGYITQTFWIAMFSIVPRPSIQFQTKDRQQKKEGAWEAIESAPQPIENIELFWRESHTHWCYLGTFQLVARGTQLLNELLPASREAIMSDTILFPDLTPPILQDITKDMYHCGLLKVLRTAWRRVGFNGNLANALQDTFQQAHVKTEPTTIPLPRPGEIPSHKLSKLSKKRGREGEAELRAESHKKHKGE